MIVDATVQFVHMHIFVWENKLVCTRARAQVCVCVCVCVRACLRARVFVRVHVRVCLSVCVPYVSKHPVSGAVELTV